MNMTFGKRLLLVMAVASPQGILPGPAIRIRPARAQQLVKQVNIPGTKVFITPPAQFRLAAGFTGLEKSATIGITIVDTPGGNFYTNAARVNKQTFEAKGIKVFSYKELTINGFPAKLLYMQANPTVKTYLLTFGDTSFSVLATGLFTSEEEEGEQIKQALLSITYHKRVKADPLAVAPFQLDEKKSAFKFVKATAGLFYYALGGLDKKDSSRDPMLFLTSQGAVSTSPYAIALAYNLDKSLVNKHVANSSTQRINGYEAYQETAYGTRNGQKSVSKTIVVVNRNRAVVLYGVAYSDFEATVKEMEKLVQTIVFK
ncbi:MAG: hypothetical protein EOO61_08420 [Hymenobacter sp.]|nr:MAG: hypothetical protein EOO61_08420 [Hymenobacter sp.]